METLGIITQKPNLNKSGNWGYLDICFDNSDEFNEATSKLMNILYKTNAEGKCLVSDEKGNKFVLDLVHSTFDTKNNIIRIFPNSCQNYNSEKPKKEKSQKK